MEYIKLSEINILSQKLSISKNQIVIKNLKGCSLCIHTFGT